MSQQHLARLAVVLSALPAATAAVSSLHHSHSYSYSYAYSYTQGNSLARSSYVVDPTREEAEAVIYAPSGAEDVGFGSSVAANSFLTAAGTTAGSVHLYERSQPNASAMVWRPLGSLSSGAATEGTEFDSYGAKLALSESVLAVAAPTDSLGAGAVYLYWADSLLSDTSSASPAAVLRPITAALSPPPLAGPLASAATSFGAAVAVDDDDAFVSDGSGSSLPLTTLLVGAPGASNAEGINKAGAAYLYVYDASAETWALDFELFGQSGSSGDGFGSAVALSGSSAIVGAPGRNHTSSGKHGTSHSVGIVYLFERSVVTGDLTGVDDDLGAASVQWAALTSLQPSDLTADARFGQQVALSSSAAVVSATDTSTGEGLVYVFVKSQGAKGSGSGKSGNGFDFVWTQSQVLRPTAGTAGAALFGSSLALHESVDVTSTADADAAATSSSVASSFKTAGSHHSSSDTTTTKSVLVFVGAPAAAAYANESDVYAYAAATATSSDADSALATMYNDGFVSGTKMNWAQQGDALRPDSASSSASVFGSAMAMQPSCALNTTNVTTMTAVLFVGAVSSVSSVEASIVYAIAGLIPAYVAAYAPGGSRSGDDDGSGGGSGGGGGGGGDGDGSDPIGKAIKKHPVMTITFLVIAAVGVATIAGTMFFFLIYKRRKVKEGYEKAGGDGDADPNSAAATDGSADGLDAGDLEGGRALTALQGGAAVAGGALLVGGLMRSSSTDSKQSGGSKCSSRSRRSSRSGSGSRSALSRSELTERGLVPEYSPMHGADGAGATGATPTPGYAAAAASTTAKLFALVGGAAAGIRRSLSRSSHGVADGSEGGSGLYPEGDADTFVNSRDSGDVSGLTENGNNGAAAASGLAGVGAGAAVGVAAAAAASSGRSSASGSVNGMPPRHQKAGSSGGSVASAKSKSSRNDSSVSDMLRRGQMVVSSNNSLVSRESLLPAAAAAGHGYSSVSRTNSTESSGTVSTLSRASHLSHGSGNGSQRL